jgi:hypothetical protein
MRYNRRLAKHFFMALWIYSLIVWGWIGVNYYVYPRYQLESISIYVPIPQDILADIAFPVSFISLVVWLYLREADRATTS